MFSRADCRPTNSTSKVDKEDVIVDDISKADTFIIHENGTIIQIFHETDVNLGDPNLCINLNLSKAEALSAVKQLDDHGYNIITTHKEHDDSLGETFFCEVVNDNIIITIDTEENNSVTNTERKLNKLKILIKI